MENIFIDKKLKDIFVFLCVCASVFFLTKAIGEIKNYKYIGQENSNGTIVFSGHGEISAVPDIASIYFNVSEKAPTQSQAETKVSEKTNAIISYLRSQKIDDKDIKTENNSTNQNYEYSNPASVPEPAIYPSYPPRTVQNGYVADRSISVKLRDTDTEYVGAIVKKLNELGVSNMSGPNYTFDDESKFKDEARILAIKDAKKKAMMTANSVGLKLGKIVDFQENGYSPMPYYRTMSAESKDAGAPVIGELPKGENKITIDVTVTYRIR